MQGILPALFTPLFDMKFLFSVWNRVQKSEKIIECLFTYLLKIFLKILCFSLSRIQCAKTQNFATVCIEWLSILYLPTFYYPNNTPKAEKLVEKVYLALNFGC